MESYRELKRRKPTKTLYFEGAGWSGANISTATIGNCRIRTAFHLKDGRAVYLEIMGTERTKNCSPKVYQWQYTGFVDDCFYITDEKPNDDQNKHSIRLTDRRRVFEYTEAAILKLVNSLGANFTAVKVVPDLGGYRVFPEERSCGGPSGYYGDEFPFDPEMTARRQAVYKYVYDMEEKELAEDRAAGANRLPHSLSGQDYPCFSLWVDEYDSGLLHLMRSFIGFNRHWTIRTDTGATLESWLATMQETPLGKYGC